MFKKTFAKQRMNRLCSFVSKETEFLEDAPSKESGSGKNSVLHNYNVLTKKLAFAGLKISPLTFLALSLSFALLISLFSSSMIAWQMVPLIFALSLLSPWLFIDSMAEKHASEFAKDYTELLQAMAYALRSGHSAQIALGHAANLLPENNAVRAEVELLLSNLHKGENQREAISSFASDRDIPELALFRNAFLLVMADGGRFSPTLLRLALLSRQRDNLKKSVQVSTATMKMTGNILLIACPLVILMVSARSDSFWAELQSNNIASAIFSAGILLTILGYISLKSMGRYKP